MKSIFYYALKCSRNDFAKQIRKLYESHKIVARRCDMKDYTIRTDGFSNTLSTVEKDTYVVRVEKE